jgi:hypothetical protein
VKSVGAGTAGQSAVITILRETNHLKYSTQLVGCDVLAITKLKIDVG